MPDLERLSGVSKESLYKYLRGRTAAPRGDVLSKLAKVFGRSAVELEYGIVTTDTQPLARIPLLRGSDLDTLYPLTKLVTEWDGPTVTVPSSFAADGVFALVIEDQANSPSISAGDFVIVNPHKTPDPGDFVVAHVERLAAGVCRKYRPSDAIPNGNFQLIASNEDYPVIHVWDDNPGKIIGRAVGVFKAL